MSSPSPQLPLGQVIGSRYRVQSLIGRGGMGMVYSAMHELTGRRVALKIMLADTDETPVLHDRFLSEARIAAAVRHPNIVDVLDMGLHGGAPFIVMELLEGMSLEQVLSKHTQLTVEQTLMWLLPIIGALAVLHEAGIVHRDVKPSNIFMSSLPRHPMRPKLLDFGLARVVSDLRLTRSGTVIGTPLYMAPEHAAGLSTGAQADVWSIGVVIYECLAGVSPFNYSDRSSLALQVLAGLVRPLSEVRPDLPPNVCAVVGHALQRDLTRRYPDMRSLAQALHAAARVSGIPLPADPDPIGLPEYVSWHRGEGHATTHEHVVSPASSPGLRSSDANRAFASTPTPSHQTPTVASTPMLGGAAASQTRPSRTRSLRGVMLGSVLLVLVAGVWWLRRAPEQTPSLAPDMVAPASLAAPAPSVSAPTVESLTRRAAEPATRSGAGQASVADQAGIAGQPGAVSPSSDAGTRALTGNATSAGNVASTNRKRGTSDRANSRRGPPATDNADTSRADDDTVMPKPRLAPKAQEPSDEVESEWK